MKKFLVLFFAVTVSYSAISQNNDAVNSYIDRYKQLAIDEMIRTGVPASITLAQGILESSAGCSELTTESNNHFGIKCKGDWTGDVTYHDDDRKNECFRSYKCAEDSYRDHSDFLRSRPNYTSLFNIDVSDYKAWAYGLKSAGYATSPVYAAALIRTIENYNLGEVTNLGLLEANQVDLASAPVKLQEQFAFKDPAAIVGDNSATNEVNPKISNVYPEGVFTINDTKVVYAKEGTSLFAIASKYNIAFPKLLSYNDLDKVDIVKKGVLIYLEKKQKRGSKEFHIALPNEDLHDIAQEEGVRLENLLAYNNITNPRQLKAGDKILLRGEGRKLF